jgi:hypothetical protein
MSEVSKFLGFDQQTPTPQFTPLDAQTQGLIKEQAASAMRPSNQFGNELNQGINQRVGQIGQFGNTDMANTGMTQGMHEALRNAYSGQTGDALDRIKFTNSIEGDQKKAQALRLASQNAMQQQQTRTNYFQTLTDSYNQMEAQRAQFVSAISGLGQHAMGTYAGARSKNVSPHSSPDMSMNQNMFNGNSYQMGGQPQQPSYLGDYNFGGNQ